MYETRRLEGVEIWKFYRMAIMNDPQACLVENFIPLWPKNQKILFLKIVDFASYNFKNLKNPSFLELSIEN